MKTFRYVALIMIAALLLSACGASAPAEDKTPLRVAASLWPGVYPMAVAQDQGFFAKHNVQVEITYYENYPQTYADFAANKLDGLDVVPGDALLISEKKPLKFVFASDYSDGADQIVATADIQSPADLKGKRIGVNFGTYGELLMRTLLEQNGLSVTDVELVNIPAEDAASAFPSKVDVIHTYEPYTSEILKNGAHVMFTSGDAKGLVMGVMAFDANVVAQRPEDVQNFTDAWFEAVDWMNTNPDQAVASIAKVLNLPTDYIWFDGDPILTRAESKAFMQTGNDFTSAYFVTQKYIDFLSTAGVLTKAVTPEQIIVPTFIKK